MANLRQDRVPDPTLSHTSALAGEAGDVNGSAAAARPIALSIRLRTSDSSGATTGVSWAGDSPAAVLAVDIITASGGAIDPQTASVLSARFFNLQSALLGARRLVWALEGLADSTHSATAATIAIHSLEEALSDGIAPALESLALGEIVLSTRTAEIVRQLPGMNLREAPGGNWRELQWRSQANNLAADEQSVLGLIRTLGREDPLAARVDAPPPPPAPVNTPTTGTYQAPARLGRSLEEPETAPFWKKPWVMVSAGAAVLVLLGALIVPGLVSGNHSKAPAAPDSGAKSAPVPVPADTPSVPAAQENVHDQKPAVKSARAPKTEPRPEPRIDTRTEPAAPKPASSSCALTEGEIPLSLQRAERLMYAGKLPEAQSAYQRLVGCPSARDRAVEGLRLVKLRIAAQSPSPP
jgi:hypothetical protein